MSYVKTKDIDFNCRYVNTELFGEFDDVKKLTSNLEKIYAYIDDKEGGSIIRPYGKAYRKILKLARAYAGARGYIISKRQVANLIKVYEDKGELYVKIPYAVDYIFKAIFTIIEEYKMEDTNIPDDIKNMFGLIRRDYFYKEQSFSYSRIYRRSEERIRYNLNMDLNSENCTLERRF